MVLGKKLELLFDTIRLLNSSRDTDYILSKLLKDAVDMTPGADAGILFLWDEKEEHLIPKTYINLLPSLEGVRVKSGESMTGMAFEKRETLFFNNREKVKEGMKSMSKDNFSLARAAGSSPEKINSSICCPLLFRDEPIGVMVIDNLGESPLLTEEDVEFITLISEQATTAIANSISYATELEQKELLEEQYNIQKRAGDIHAKLTTNILNGSSEKELLVMISELTEHDAFILDKFGGLRLDRFKKKRAREKLMKDLGSLKDRLDASAGEIVYRGKNQLYVCFAIIVKKELMGWLCLASEEEFHDMNKAATERMASILAIHYLKEYELLSKEVSYRADMLERAMVRKLPEDIENFTKFYSIPRFSFYRILLFQMEFNPHVEEKEKEEMVIDARNDLYRFLSLIKENKQEKWFVSIHRERIFVLLYDEERRDGQTYELIDLIKEHALDKPELYGHMEMRIGLSSWISSLLDLREAHEEAQYILFSEQDIMDLNSQRIMLLKLLRSIEKKDAESLIRRVLGPLVMHEELMETLRVYSQHQGRWARTKDALNIHGNTLTYRLRKIESLINLEVKEYPDRLLIDLACELYPLWPEALH